MKIVVFGLSVSSAWGNGHATLLRGLFRSLHSMGHQIVFYEKDVPYYAANRDADSFPYVDLRLYNDWAALSWNAQREVLNADVAIVTSYCPDGKAACDLVIDSQVPCAVFYDMDTPVTLGKLDRGEPVSYLPDRGLGDFDVVLSYTGGPALGALRRRLGAQRVEPLYGWVDPDIYYPVTPGARFAADLSYLGTYSSDRQQALDELLLNPARTLPEAQFLVAGALYPETMTWPSNVKRFEHVNPGDHREFYSSTPLSLNVTRGSMAAMGYCPSGRLFEAAACGSVIVGDWWEGLDQFFAPELEILVVRTKADVLEALRRDRASIQEISRRAQERTLDCHTARSRAQRLLSLVEQSSSRLNERAQFETALGD